MIDEQLLWRVVQIQGGALLALLVGLAVHAVWLRRRRAFCARTAGARVALTVAVSRRDRVPPAELGRLPSGLVDDVVTATANVVGGGGRDVLHAIAARAGVISRAERFCRSRRWWRRLRGVYLLAPYQASAPLMYALLDDRHPAVRTIAIEWLGDHPSVRSMEAALRFVDDPHPLCRFTARDALVRGGSIAVGPILERLRAGGDSATAAAITEVATMRPDVAYAEVAERFVLAPAREMRAAGATLIAAIGGSGGLPSLVALLGDEDEMVRAAAAAATGKLGLWSAAAKVAELLGDRAWHVRAAASEALVQMGPPGILLLRRALHADDRFARDAARQRLEIAGIESGLETPVVTA